MTDNFAFNAPQFVDFTQGIEEDLRSAEAYFDIDHEGEIQTRANVGLRRSISTGNIFTVPSSIEEPKDDCLSEPMKNLNIEKPNDVEMRQRTRTNGVTRITRSRSASRDRLAQPKQQQQKNQAAYHSVAESVLNFEKKFRVAQDFKRFHNHVTTPYSPALKTKERARLAEAAAVSHNNGQEKKDMEEAKKFKIKAKPVNTKILYGPVKPQAPVEKKPNTVVEPFKITATAPKQVTLQQETETFKFQAKPVPKAIYNPPKIPPRPSTPSATKPPIPLKRLLKQRSLDSLHRPSSVELNNTQLKPTKIQAFSFDERNKMLQKKKDEFINKVLEEEKKAREFHARPPPKYLQQQATHPHDITSHSEIVKRTTTNVDNIQQHAPQFKARPPTVLYKKPFEPKPEAKPLTEITEFNLNTDKRAKERELFEEDLRKKQERLEQLRKEEEEKLLAEEQKEIAFFRKQAEHKANPVRHYKELVIKKNNIITVPISPKFLTEERLKNKENVQQGM